MGCLEECIYFSILVDLFWRDLLGTFDLWCRIYLSHLFCQVFEWVHLLVFDFPLLRVPFTTLPPSVGVVRL